MATTALTKYQRLEAAGLWRADESAQRLDVIVSVGEATLTITDLRDRVQTHWSIAAIARANPGQRPAIYHPDGDPGETLELPEDEAEMIATIETLRSAVARQRPRPGRLRLIGVLAVLAAVIVLATVWLPGVVRDHALRVVPAVKRAEIGQALVGHLHRATGPACRGPGGRVALAALARRLPPRRGSARFTVVRSGLADVLRLPGGTMMIPARLVEAYEEPDVVAGHVIAAYLRAEARDPLERLLADAGPIATLRLLTTGHLIDETLRAHAETLVDTRREATPGDAMLDGFKHWQVRATPFATEHDMPVATRSALVDGDPFAPAVPPPPPILRDGDWLRLQGICGG
ncbi:hypothetical protein [Roseovarius sp. D22-M7]|uniref:hypothetical protein n=1 Tax=Roseovarius sp. D22-M7 TaxID=3127116 RepID=UPI003010398F